MAYIYVLHGVSEQLCSFVMKASFKAYRFLCVCCSLNRRGARSEPDWAKWRRLRLQCSPHLSASPSSSRELRRDDRLRVSTGLACTVGKWCTDTCCFKEKSSAQSSHSLLKNREIKYLITQEEAICRKIKATDKNIGAQIGFQKRKITSTHHAH